MDAEETQPIRTHSSLSIPLTLPLSQFQRHPKNHLFLPPSSSFVLFFFLFSFHSPVFCPQSATSFSFSRFPTFLILYKPLNLHSFSHFKAFCASGQLNKVKVLAVLLPFVFLFSFVFGFLLKKRNCSDGFVA